MSDQAYIRIFICFELPHDILERIREIQDDLKSAGHGVRWVNPKGIHLTLKFLGDVEKSRVPQIADAVKSVAAGCKPMTIGIRGTGVFPNSRNPRVFWIGVDEPSGALANCQNAVEGACEALGYPREKRKFSPHLTLGRVNEHADVRDVAGRLLNLDPEPMEFTASEIVIMQSILKQTGAEYKPLYPITI